MRILVTAASRHGATAGIAAALGDRLASLGHDVDLRPPEEVVDVGEAEAVVLGSAVYAGLWLKAAREAVDRLAPQLRLRPTWLFSSGPLGDPPVTGQEPDVAGYVEATGALEHRTFPGALDLCRLMYSERLMVRALHAPVGDFRDLRAVEAWADHIHAQLGRRPRTAAGQRTARPRTGGVAAA
ncbi:menaquinone-dependent protoporphyrinogen oxidase [Georgenia soli]|uniref:Menaquinone-dependent protoporphyrinogen oxidase n=1 Tax=Georgenia soli TaxID=638953 RepID=A0A2A9EPP8_9MICO|nr:flavodoxin domain-containing protein [Georgenia soli]PFG40753.1 menaquinone-dependent protoporphyrinogen oxidase [Georgenia soli]